MEELIKESQRLKAEIDELTRTAQQRDPDGDYSADAYIAQSRLTRLNDDYRQLLTAIATGERTAATRTTKPPARYRMETAYGIFEEDDNGNIVQIVPPNADEEMKKNIERRNAEGLIRERETNAQAGRGYLTTAERQKYELDARARGVDEGTLAESIRQFDASQRNKDREFLQSERKTTADIALTGAQTGRTISETGLTEARIAELQAKTPAEIEEMQARGELSRVQAEEVRRKAKLPTVLEGLSTGPTITSVGPGGEITETRRQGYVPKTLGEIAARGGQMQQAMQAKGADIQKRVDARTITPEQGKQEWETWYDSTVAPEMQTLQAAQEDAMYARGKEEAATRTAAYTAADRAAQTAVEAYKAQAPRRVGPGAAQMFGGALNAINRAAKLPEQDYSALITKAPNIMRETPEQAATRVLQAISPTAAQNAGQPMPNYAGFDIAGGLARTRWAPQGGPPPPAAAPAAPGQWPSGATTPIMTTPEGQTQWQYRFNTGGGPPLDTTGFGGAIGNDPMAAAMQAAQAQAAPPPPVAAAAPVRRFAPSPRPVARAPAAAPVGNMDVDFAPGSLPTPAPVGNLDMDFPAGSLPTPYVSTDYMSQIPVAPPVEAPVQYMPSDYQFPGMQGILDAARKAYQAVPRVQFGTGGWRRPY